MTIARLGPGPIIGVDVGEDYLDLAVIDNSAAHLRLARVAVRGVERIGIPTDFAAIGELRRRLIAAVPELGASGAIALIDSPRWPLDLHPDAGDANHTDSAGSSTSRAIDTALRGIVRRLHLRKRDGTQFRLSLFPTPRFEFFAACLRDPHCKPHLAALGRELFGAMIDHGNAGIAPVGGRIFTRFMITGFAAYRAIQGIGAESYEAYPDLAFRLWAEGVNLPPKSAGRRALHARAEINRRLAGQLSCMVAQAISTLDEADAAVLALSTARARRTGVMAVIDHRGEGRFALAMDREQARLAALVRPGPD